MSNDTAILILVGVLLIAIVVLIFGFLINERLKNRSEIKSKHSSGTNFWYSSYLFFSKFFLTRQYIGRVKKRIEILELADNFTIGRNTMQFAYLSFMASFLVFTLLLAFGRDLYFFAIALIMAYIVHNQILSLFVDQVEKKILVQFEKFLGDVRYNYHEHGMIDEAIFDSIEDCGYEMSLHANKIYEILKASEVEEEIERYNEMAPNKFFKTFLALCQTVLRFDDKKVDNKSMFLTNLNYLKQEINVELLKREKLSYLFKSLSLISIAPIFTLKPLEIWAQGNLPELMKYYKGAYGFVESIVIFVLVIISYQLINKLQSNVSENPILSNFEDKILKIKSVVNAMDRLVNMNYSRALKYMDLLKNTGSKTNIRAFYLKRIIYSMAGFFVALMVFLNVYSITRDNIISSVDEGGYTATQTLDTKAVEELKKMNKKLTMEYRGKKTHL